MSWQIEKRDVLKAAPVDGGGRTTYGPWYPMEGWTGYATSLEAQEAFVMAMDPQIRFGSAQYMRAQFRWMSRAQGVRVAKAAQS